MDYGAVTRIYTQKRTWFSLLTPAITAKTGFSHRLQGTQIFLLIFIFVIHFSRVYVYSVYCIVEPNYSNYNCNSGMWKMGRMSKQHGRLCSTLKVLIRAEITLSNWPSHQHITRTYRYEINFLFPHLNCFDLKIILY